MKSWMWRGVFLVGCAPADGGTVDTHFDPVHSQPGTDSPPPPPSTTPAPYVTPAAAPTLSWTVAVFMNGDNDLEPLLFPDLEELERAAVGGIQIVAQVDRIPGYSAIDGDWTGARRYEIVPHLQPGVVSPPVADLGEVNMGGKKALGDFLVWANTTYPADHFALVFWNHGGGFWISDDDTNGSKLQLDGELQGALDQIVSVRGPLDVIAFDACNMAEWEVGVTLAPFADVMVASEAWIGNAGYAYDTAFPQVMATDDAVAFGDLLAASAVETNGELMQSAVDLREIGALTDALDLLATVALVDDAHLAEWVAARDRAKGTDKLWDDFWLDLGSLVDELASGSALPDLVAPAQDVRAALDRAVIASYTSPELSWASGLTVYAETGYERWVKSYQDGPWAHTVWADLITAVAAYEESLE
jgi:hypothetical protein